MQICQICDNYYIIAGFKPFFLRLLFVLALYIEVAVFFSCSHTLHPF